ncbi:MAG: NAD(P)H-binding protein [Dehalococcoidia bacterium]
MTVQVVTGASGFTGKYIARRLLDRGDEVRTITGHPGRPGPFGDRVRAYPFSFEDPSRLVEALRGASVLYNTYWVRFSRGASTFDAAVNNTRTLIRAAEEAGIERIVHVSITNPSETSSLPYFRGKALLERAIRESSLSHAILRPAVIFGDEDVLINNIAWLLRRFPLFVVPGLGEYRLQPIYVDDMAELAVSCGESRDNVTIDAIGPDTFSFNELVALLKDTVASRARIVHLPPRVALALSRVVGVVVRDVVLTPDEVDGLLADLLVTQSPPAGKTRLADWLREHRDTIGKRYASELAKHFR